MGQRLNIEIEIDDKCVANCYYHWSADALSAKSFVKDIITYLRRCRQKEPTIKAIRCLEKTGAGLPPFEMSKIKELYPATRFKKCTNRNEGLISITKDGMKETRNKQECMIIIDITNKMIDFDVYMTYNINEGEYSNEQIERMKKVNPYNLTFDEFIKNYDTFATEPVIYDSVIVTPIE